MTFDLSAETLKRTTLGTLRPDQKVNLEASLRTGDSLGGHFVLGHVDATGKILAKVPQGSWVLYEFMIPPGFQRYLVPKGSVAVDGISLTVVEPRDNSFSAAVIPHTEKNTTLGYKNIGNGVNLEGDILAKHVEKLLEIRETGRGR
jgi:riboflavin synthase